VGLRPSWVQIPPLAPRSFSTGKRQHEILPVNEKDIIEFLSRKRGRKSTELTIKTHLRVFRNFKRWLGRKRFNVENCQRYLDQFENENTQANHAKLIRVLAQMMGRHDILKAIKVSQPAVNLDARVITKDELRRFYKHITNPRLRAAFILLATSGMRPRELFLLSEKNIKFIDGRIEIYYEKNVFSTKRAFFHIANSEAAEALRGLSKLYFPRRLFYRWWKKVKDNSGVNITPYDLRKFFENELFSRGVKPEIINFLAGRTPVSVLERNYLWLIHQARKEYPQDFQVIS